MEQHVSIIGAGIAGLATAIRLAAKGNRVTVYERSDGPGGKLNMLEWEGFRWDTGPSLLTLPGLMEELYQLAGEEMDRAIPLRKLEVITRYFYENGKILDAYGDPRRFAGEAEKVFGEPASRVLQYLERSRRMYDLTSEVFIFNHFWRPGTFFSKKFLKALLRIRKLEPMTTMHEVNTRSFRSRELIQLFDRYATYNGSDPFRAPGTLNMIAHLEHNLGAWFPEHGMYSIAKGLKDLAERLGAEFHFGRPVERVAMKGQAVRGVVTAGETIHSDVVVSDIDIYYLYRDLLEGIPFPEKALSKEKSTSALIFYWAIDGTFPGLELHNILFSDDYRGEFRILEEKQEIFHDPTVYLFISSRVVHSDAPEGKENWFVMINVPENRGQDWDRLIGEARQSVLKKIEQMLGKDVAPLILKEFILDPRTIEAGTFSHRGALYGNSSNSRTAAFGRHPNSLRRVKGLYFVGGSVHPGGGIPLCLASARIVDEMINRN
ncbi:MAG: 1-hydroxycarotenoid 3,4-desaturase CrtD [Bacteroidales bacterium]